MPIMFSCFFSSFVVNDKPLMHDDCSMDENLIATRTILRTTNIQENCFNQEHAKNLIIRNNGMLSSVFISTIVNTCFLCCLICIIYLYQSSYCHDFICTEILQFVFVLDDTNMLSQEEAENMIPVSKRYV